MIFSINVADLCTVLRDSLKRPDGEERWAGIKKSIFVEPMQLNNFAFYQINNWPSWFWGWVWYQWRSFMGCHKCHFLYLDLSNIHLWFLDSFDFCGWGHWCDCDTKSVRTYGDLQHSTPQTLPPGLFKVFSFCCISLWSVYANFASSWTHRDILSELSFA